MTKYQKNPTIARDLKLEINYYAGSGFLVSYSVSVRIACHLAVAAAFAMVVGFSTQARAVEFIGFTNGCFGLDCTPTSNPSPTFAQIGGLTYNSSTFQVTSAGGFVAIGNTPATPNFNNLGSFSLDNTPFGYSGSHFDLLVSFTAPVGTSPNSVLVKDLIVGTVDTTGGGIFIDFGNTPKLFT